MNVQAAIRRRIQACLRLLATVILLGALLVGVFDALERHFIFFPTRALHSKPSAYGMRFRDLSVATTDGLKLHGWYVPSPSSQITLLFLHGNAGNISDRLEKIRLFVEAGWDVFILDYRGYGRSEGEPTEEGIYEDAQAAHRSWIRMEESRSHRLVLLGESLGSAVAVDLAARRIAPLYAVILEGTFPHARDMARKVFPFLPLGYFIESRFDSASKVPHIAVPKLFVHAARDEVVPLELGQRLFELAAPPKQFYRVEGARHNDAFLMPGYVARMKEFLASIEGTKASTAP
ncbi:MAG: alpha/beta hydrolase [Acidobacteria bacterium]|nr:alpha/beta hydrolase [Acidobacteriota bacterium]